MAASVEGSADGENKAPAKTETVNSSEGSASSTSGPDRCRSATDETTESGENKKTTTRSVMLRARGRAKNFIVDTLLGALARGLDAFDCFIKVLGPIFMLLALTLFSFETYTFFAFVLPVLGEDWPIQFQVFVTVVGVFLLANLLYNYLKAVCTDPGSPPIYERWEELESGVVKDSEEIGLKQPPPKPHPQCQKCLRQKPARTHHCSICKRCVLKMDHHCPWINNCVGYRNYRYFCLFMFYLMACCLFVAVVFFDGFLESMAVHSRNKRMTFQARQCVSLCWIIALCIFLALCILGGFHLYLVLTNQTTIEFHTNMANKSKAKRRGEYYRNPYDLGRRRNFKQVFGPDDFYSLLWAMPYFATPPPGDGMSFPT